MEQRGTYYISRLKNAYIGDKQQLFARIIFNRLTEKHPRNNKDSEPPIPPTTEK